MIAALNTMVDEKLPDLDKLIKENDETEYKMEMNTSHTSDNSNRSF